MRAVIIRTGGYFSQLQRPDHAGRRHNRPDLEWDGFGRNKTARTLWFLLEILD